jgi:hypothetical protein
MISLLENGPDPTVGPSSLKGFVAPADTDPRYTFGSAGTSANLHSSICIRLVCFFFLYNKPGQWPATNARDKFGSNFWLRNLLRITTGHSSLTGCLHSTLAPHGDSTNPDVNYSGPGTAKCEPQLMRTTGTVGQRLSSSVGI